MECLVRTIALLSCLCWTACGSGAGADVVGASQTGLVVVEGYLVDNTHHASVEGSRDPEERPVAVRVHTYDDGDPEPVASTTLTPGADGSFAGIVAAGDRYGLDILDPLDRAGAGGFVVATAIEGNATLAAFLTGDADGLDGLSHTYTFVPSSETLSIDATLVPLNPDGPSITHVRYGYVQGGYWKSDTSVAVTPDTRGAVTVDVDVSVFEPGCGYVALSALDTSGDPVDVSLGGTATTPSAVYVVSAANSSSFILFKAGDCAGGWDTNKYKKKEKEPGRLILKKKGKMTGTRSDDGIWCILCPEGGAVPADGFVPASATIIKPPTVLCDRHAGVAPADGDVFIECQTRYNRVNKDLVDANKKENDKGEAEAAKPDKPVRVSGVTYLSTAFEPPEMKTQGKKVQLLRWFQRINYKVTYTSPSGNGVGSNSNDKYVWDDTSEDGQSHGDNSYFHQTTSQSYAQPTGTATNHLNTMEDSPGIGVPASAAEAERLACESGITGAAKTTWTSITFSVKFQTMLVCCQDPKKVLAVYEWELSVTIKKNADGTYSSSVTTTDGGPKEKLEDGAPQLPTDTDWEMPC